MATATIYANQSARIKLNGDPLFNEHAETISLAGTESHDAVLMSFDVDANLRKKQLVTAQFYFYINGDGPKVNFGSTLYSAFDEETVNQSTVPLINYYNATVDVSTSYAWRNATISYLSALKRAMQYGLILRSMNYTVGSTSYVTDEAFNVYNSRSANKPYLVLTYYDAPITVKNCNPTSGFCDKSHDHTFSWDFYTTAVTVDALSQTSAKFRWRPDSLTPYTEVAISGATSSYTLPANTVTTDSFQWQVEVTADSGTTATSDWFTLSTVDSTSTCTDLSPIQQYIDGSEDQVFSWTHNIDTGTAQTAFDLQYSSDGGSNWISVFSHQATANQYVTVPADTLPAGNLLWQVRTYNSDDAAGTWSDSAAIVVIARPALPSFTTITSAARPTINWSAVGQQAYEINITDADGDLAYSTGEIASVVKQHRVVDYLDDGTYTVALRVENEFGLFSEWAEISLTISTTKPDAPVLSGTTSDGATLLSFSRPGEYTAVYVMRDDLPIAKADGNSFTDNPMIGTHAYKIRAVDANDCFSDSNIATIDTTVSDAQMIYAGTDGSVKADLIYNVDDSPVLSGSMENVGSAYVAAGRTYPVYEFSEAKSENMSLSYALVENADFEALRDMARSATTLLFRSSSGIGMYCVITSFSWQHQAPGYYTCDFSISRVDYEDRIDYDAPEV